MKYIRALISLIQLSIVRIKNPHVKCSIFNNIGKRTRINIEKGSEARIGRKFSTRNNVEINVRRSAELVIGNNVFFNSNCIVTVHKKLKIGNSVQFGPGCMIFDHDHDLDNGKHIGENIYKMSAIEIDDNTWIGANVVILRGTKIGRNCIIGAGCVLKGNYPENSVIIQKRENVIYPRV